MPDSVVAIVFGALRLAAVAWLCVAAPLDLAVGLAALLTTPARLGPVAVALVAARIAVVATGLVLGRRLVRPGTYLGPQAAAWASADLVTLATVLATDALPTSRAPGDAIVVWAVYATAAAVVLMTAMRDRRPPTDERQ